MDLKDIETRVLNKRAVSDTERAYLIRNNPRALAAFMVENNPGNVRKTLKNLGYKHLDFQPNQEQLAATLKLVLDRAEADTWGEVLQNFKLITDGMPQGFLNALNAQFN